MLRDNPFAYPHGLIGRLVGHIMAVFNAEINWTVIDMLQLQCDERVLEIGFGPGVAIALLAARLTSGHVSGIDPSDVMLRQASRRNRRAIQQGRVELRLGTASELPWPDAYFDAVISVNNVMLWNLEKDMLEVRRVLHGEGRLVIGLHQWAARGVRWPEELEEKVMTVLSLARFRDAGVRKSRVLVGRAMYFTARG